MSPRILDARRTGRGWVIQVDALAGYRFYARKGSAGYPQTSDATHLFSPSAGLQTTYWFSQHFGFNLRLSAGVSLPPHGTSDFPYSIDFGLELGIAVH